MRILVLSCSTGGGHNSAADAICAHLTERGIECDVRDALLFVSKAHAGAFSYGHSLMYRYFPRLFGVGYYFEENHQPRFLYKQMALGVKRFCAFVKKNAYDAVICTHIFGNMLVTEARRKFGITIPHYVVTTDYTVHPGTDMVDAERYFIAAEQLRPLLSLVGISDERIVASGIPVAPAFLKPDDKRSARLHFGLPEEGKLVLLFSGSIGCGKLHSMATELERQLPDDCTLVVLCGHNKGMYTRLRRRCGSRTVVVGYTKEVAEYMAAADLCIAKPGGLSTTEMWSMALPMILLLTVPGCETRNLKFLSDLGIAEGTDDWREAVRITLDLIGDDDRLAQMREHLRNTPYPGGACVIADEVLADIAEKERRHD